MPDLIAWLPLVPDLTRRLSVMPHLARRLTTDRLTTDRLTAERLTPERLTTERLGSQGLLPAVAVRDNWRDRTPDPERAEPLLSLDVTRVAGHVVAELTGLGVLTVVADRAVVVRLALSRLPPASAPPGHS